MLTLGFVKGTKGYVKKGRVKTLPFILNTIAVYFKTESVFNHFYSVASSRISASLSARL